MRWTSSSVRCGRSASVGSLRITRVAPSSGQLLRALDERVDLPLAAGAVDEADVELLARGEDRLARLEQVRHVVERVVKPEDVDPVVGRAGDEAAHDVGGDGSGAGRGTGRGAPGRAASSCARRSRGCAPMGSRPRAGRPSRRRRRPRPRGRQSPPVEDLGDPQHLAGRELAGQRVLREQANGGVDDLGHGVRGP